MLAIALILAGAAMARHYLKHSYNTYIDTGISRLEAYANHPSHSRPGR